MDTLSVSSADPAGELELVPGRESGISPVSQDMEAIFGRSEALSRRAFHPGHAVVPIFARSSEGRAGAASRRIAIPVVAIAAALVVAIGLMPHGARDTSPGGGTPLPAAAPPIDDLDRSFAAAEPQSISATVTSMARNHWPHKVVADREPGLRASGYGSNREAARSSDKARSQAGRPCARLGRLALARCMRPQIVIADRQLRNAYRHAIRRGVDRRVLISYRDQWSRLRGRAISDPRQVTAGFHRIAQQLDSARGRGGRSG